MAILGQICGGLAVLKGLALLKDIRNELPNAARPLQENEGAPLRVARVVSQTFRSIGICMLALAYVSIGLRMVILAPSEGFFASALSGIESAVPYAAAAVVASLMTGMAATLGPMYAEAPWPA